MFLFVSSYLFIAVWEIFQLSGGCHHYLWQGCKFRPRLSTHGFYQWGFFFVPPLLWHETSVDTVSSERLAPTSHSVFWGGRRWVFVKTIWIYYFNLTSNFCSHTCNGSFFLFWILIPWFKTFLQHNVTGLSWLISGTWIIFSPAAKVIARILAYR
jgi:hypothetical protein